MNRCTFGAGSRHPSTACTNEATWRFHDAILREHPEYLQRPFLCDDHRLAGGTQRVDDRPDQSVGSGEGGRGGGELQMPRRGTTFLVLGEPVSWQRVTPQRAGRLQRPFVPATVRQAEQEIGWAYKAAGGRLLTGPVGVFCRFYLGGSYLYAHTDARDIDNLKKTVLDGLQGAAFGNDRQVVCAPPLKRKGSPPRTVVTVWSWEDSDGTALHSWARGIGLA